MARAPVLTPQSQDFPRWYQDVIAKAELADNGPVRGTMVIRPWGYALWEGMQRAVDDRIKAAGAQNAYFPLFIPQSYLAREAEHVEGFSPELAVVTHAGGKELEEPVIVRPTSETVVNSLFAKWVQSYRDLPLLINNWSNVVRWELRPRIFLRTTEFLWQEGHTCHATAAEASAYARRILDEVYADFMESVLAIPVVRGLKTRRERFAGAVNTLACEAMMRDGKALQMGTSHELGQNFARSFDVRFTAADGVADYVWQTSWGVSTRMVGGLIMCHGDDDGLRVPPELAPTQAVVMVVKDGDGVDAAAGRALAALRAAGVRAESDTRTDTPFGRRAIDRELKGVPVRIEIGPRDAAAGNAVLVRRIPGTRLELPQRDLVRAVSDALAEDQTALFDEALRRREDNTVDVESIDAAADGASVGWARIDWARLGEDGEERLAQRGVSVRCLLSADGGVPASVEDAGTVAIVGRAY